MSLRSIESRKLRGQSPSVWLLVVLSVTLMNGCREKSSSSVKRSGVRSQRSGNSSQSKVLVDNFAFTLNDLASRNDTVLVREEKILDATNSADGKEILAMVSVVNEGAGATYLQVPLNNANFRDAGVKKGDIVRLYTVDLDTEDKAESAERGMAVLKALSLKVRRLDERNPDNALILDVGLNQATSTPERIEVWRFSNRRAQANRSAVSNYLRNREPATNWMPTPDQKELDFLSDTATRWLRNRADQNSNWSPTELLATLPEDLRQAESIKEFFTEESLSSKRVTQGDSRLLQQAVWMRDISDWARGNAVTDLEVATALFDWTIRNVWAVPPEQAVDIHHPWQAVVYGRGTVEDRAWVFAELCRQQQVAVVMLSVGEKTSVAFWLPAALIEGELYLFDAQLGLPLVAKGDGSTLTLSQVLASPELLNASVKSEEEGNGYRVGADELRQVSLSISASLFQLSRSTELLENELEGEQIVRLFADVDGLRNQLEDDAAVGPVSLWSWPLLSMLEEQKIKISKRRKAVAAYSPFLKEPMLWKARAMHFQGEKPPLASDRANVLTEPRDGHREAIKLYTSARVRPTDKALSSMPKETREVSARMKALASLWLGQLSYDLGRFETAQFWFDAVDRENLESTRIQALNYNLARTYEQLGQVEKAITLLKETDKDSLQYAGNLQRAKGLQDETGDSLESE
ncbi:MAG: hypothetical protein RH917_02165 [Lacipirellulaceae bacterium]